MVETIVFALSAVSLREKGVDLNICLIKSYEEGDTSPFVRREWI